MALAITSKPLSELTIDDAVELCREQIAEGQHLDFKENLSGRGELGNAWNQGADTIPIGATNELARSLISFANAEGGWLVLGIREAGDHPSRAAELAPVRACHELARRLRQSLYERIDPIPVGLEARGIEMGDTGAGVIVFRMPASPYAPHGLRIEQGLQCHVRRNDECRPMTMKDIQERTLEIDRGLVAVEAAFERQRQAFARLRPAPPQAGAAPPIMGYRISAIPIRARFEIANTYSINWLSGTRREHMLHDDNGGGFRLYSQIPDGDQFRPVLRGALSKYETAGIIRELLVSSNGHVSYVTKDAEHHEGIFLGWIGADVINVLKIVDTLRTHGGNPDAEYGIEVRIEKVTGSMLDHLEFMLAPLGAQNFQIRSARIISPIQTPICRVGSSSEFGRIAVSIMSDVCNAAGWESLDGYSITASR